MKGLNQALILSGGWEPFYNKIERCFFFLEYTLIALALSSSVFSKWFPTGRFKILTTHMKKIVLSVTN